MYRVEQCKMYENVPSGTLEQPCTGWNNVRWAKCTQMYPENTGIMQDGQNLSGAIVGAASPSKGSK